MATEAPLTNEAAEVIARELMQIIQYDNGCVNRLEKERYPKRHLERITAAAATFFNANPELITEDDFENICAGEQGENQELYGKREGYKELDDALNKYFDSL